MEPKYDRCHHAFTGLIDPDDPDVVWVERRKHRKQAATDAAARRAGLPWGYYWGV